MKTIKKYNLILLTALLFANSVFALLALSSSAPYYSTGTRLAAIAAFILLSAILYYNDLDEMNFSTWVLGKLVDGAKYFLKSQGK